MDQQYRLWAPHAQAVRIVHDPENRAQDLRHATELVAAGTLQTEVLVSAGDSWFTTSNLPAHHSYGFQLYTTSGWSQVFPDPRSQRQPQGVHGLSQRRPAFTWTDHDYQGHELAGQVIYELHVGTFSEAGTFAGVIEKLPYLQQLGITAIELMPVQPFGGVRNWGYDGVDWFAVHEAYGGPLGLQKLVDAAHNLGMGVILDVVYNHFGPDGNYTGAFGPYTVPGDTGWGDVVNINGPGSDAVRSYILDCVRQWLADYHIDGLRLDAVHAYQDAGAYSIMEQMQDIAAEISTTTGIPRFLIAESDLNDPRLLAPAADGGYGLAAQWVDDIHHSVHALTSGEAVSYYRDYYHAGVAGLAKGLAHMYFFDNTYSSFRQRHHGRRIHSSIQPAQGVTYTTTHDQTGNRAQGDRPSMNLDLARLQLRAATILLSPYTPMLFMGEEFGAQTTFPFFVSHEDAHLNELTQQGRLREFAHHGWDPETVTDPTDPESFEQAKLDWEHAHSDQKLPATLFACYQYFLQLRRTYSLGQQEYAAFEVRYGENSDTAHDGAALVGAPVTGSAGWVSMAYADLVFIGNFSAQPQQVPLDMLGVASPATLRLEQADFLPPAAVAQDVVSVAPWGFAVLRR